MRWRTDSKSKLAGLPTYAWETTHGFFCIYTYIWFHIYIYTHIYRIYTHTYIYRLYVHTYIIHIYIYRIYIYTHIYYDAYALFAMFYSKILHATPNFSICFTFVMKSFLLYVTKIFNFRNMKAIQKNSQLIAAKNFVAGS